MRFRVILLTAAILSAALANLNCGFTTAEESGREYTAQDIVQLQDYLLARNADISEKYDINDDGIINSNDLTLMRKSFSQLGNTITVSDSDELQNALKNASAGDTILLESGEYKTDKSGKSGSLFFSASSGTADAPITIKSADSENPAVLSGNSPTANMVLYIMGEYWNIENIVCCNAKKGIMLDQSSYSTIRNVEVYNIGEEGIHLRDGSSECKVLDSNVHDTGMLTAKYGEAVYIGSAKSTSGYDYNCNNNLVSGCTLGPNVTAEHVDIKEYTTGNVVENCKFLGAGMTECDSFVDIKGNETVVRNNQGDTQGNTNITDAFQVHSQLEGWGRDNLVYGNSVVFAGETEYILRTWSGSSCTVYDNTRSPQGLMYRGYSGSTLTEK